MKGLIKIIGTNTATKSLQSKEFENCRIESFGKLNDLYLNEEKYFFEIKGCHFEPDCVTLFGIISDDKNFVGNIALEFYPKIES